MHAVWTLEPNGLGFAVTGSKHFLYIITKSCTCSTGRIHQQLLNMHDFPFYSSFFFLRLKCVWFAGTGLLSTHPRPMLMGPWTHDQNGHKIRRSIVLHLFLSIIVTVIDLLIC